MMTRPTILLTGLLLAAAGLIAISGCATGTTAGGTNYEMAAGGDLQAQLGHDHRKVHEAALAVSDQFGFDVTNQAVDAFAGVIKAETATGENVNISAKRVADNSTRIAIGLGGVFGDENRARQILEEIEERLGPAPAGTGAPPATASGETNK